MDAEITSKDNRMIKLARKLARRKYRDETGLFLAEGPHLAGEAVRCGAAIDFVLADRDETAWTGELRAVLAAIAKARVPVYPVDSMLFRELSDTETPQGVLAVVRRPAFDPEALCRGDLVVLDRLQDPGNIGTIVRTADAAGFTGAVIVKGSGDVYAPKTVRATAGSIFRVPVLQAASGDDALAFLREHGYRIICTLPSGTELPYDIDMRGRVALVVGNEAGGASDTFIARSDHRARIPMAGDVESLNAAIAAAIMMYEAYRQKLK